MSNKTILLTNPGISSMSGKSGNRYTVRMIMRFDPHSIYIVLLCTKSGERFSVAGPRGLWIRIPGFLRVGFGAKITSMQKTINFNNFH